MKTGIKAIQTAKDEELERQIGRSVKIRWIIMGFCLLPILILWINDLITYTGAALPVDLVTEGLTRFKANEMFIIILSFISVVSLFPAAIYFAFEAEGFNHAWKRTSNQLRRANLTEKTIIKQVRDSFETAHDWKSYLLPVVLATVALTIGWALFFFSRGLGPVWQLANDRNLSNFLFDIGNLHPIMFGFLGAFFFSLQILATRFFAADLKPSVFMHIAIRVWLVMLLTLVLSVIWQVVPLVPESGVAAVGATPVSQGSAPASLLVLIAICFIVGILPDVALDLIQKAAKTATGRLPFVRENEKPLTKIQGLNLWHQVRLSEEGVDNVQNLAQADIIDLIVHTRLGVRRLLDWIDQAQLCIHTDNDDFVKYQKAGIYTATEFVKVYEAIFKPAKAPAGDPPDLPSISRMTNHWVTITDDVNYSRLVPLQNHVKSGDPFLSEAENADPTSGLEPAK